MKIQSYKFIHKQYAVPVPAWGSAPHDCSVKYQQILQLQRNSGSAELSLRLQQPSGYSDIH